jgi:predicted transcriptional regulator of viral defense system
LQNFRNKMSNISFISFRNQFFKYGCFSTSQVLMWNNRFDNNNYTRWEKQGLIVRLRRGWFAFPEYLKVPEFQRHIAGRIYRPSYISLHHALAYYGIIPEAVMNITNITTLKTASFQNKFGNFTYQTIQAALFFGFDIKTLQQGATYAIATPEKALLDLLYLYPIYNTETEMLDLRLDEAFLREEPNLERFKEYKQRFGKAVNKRADTLFKAYGL